MAESKHAAALRSRGFTSITGPRSHMANLPPSFTATEQPPMTYATDETGNTWMATACVDLTDLGFKNQSAEVRKLREGIGRIRKPN